MVAEWDSMNEAANELLPILPHMLLKLHGKEFAEVLRKQKENLLKWWTEDEIDAIEWEFQELKLAYQNEGPLRDAFDNCDYKTPFQTVWNYVQHWFSSLKLFCGGMATAFPGTSNVESNFSIVKLEKDVTQMSLSDISLEGTLHAKQ